MNDLLTRINENLDEAVMGARRSLVQVHSGDRGAGAGSIWHPDGLIVTNDHVVRSKSMSVTLPDGTVLPARLLASDSGLDVAALAVDAKGLTAAELGESRNLRPGQWVLAIGHPWGVYGAATSGVVIGVGSEQDPSGSSPREVITVAAPLRPGNSGGPLLDAEGRLVGINTMMMGPEVGVALPVHLVKTFLKERLGTTPTSILPRERGRRF